MTEDVLARAINIYSITNKVNGRVYIGQTIQTPIHRWHVHCTDAKRGNKNHLLRTDILEYGKQGFVIATLNTVEHKETADWLEIFWIAVFMSNEAEYGYNLTSDGQSPRGIEHPYYGRPQTDEQRRKQSDKIRAFCKGKDNSNRTRAALEAWRRSDLSTDEMCRLYASGLSTKTIAAMFSTCDWTVAERLKGAGITMRRPGMQKRSSPL